MRSQLSLYISRQATSLGRYIFEQLIQASVGSIPSIIGIGIRTIVYRNILRAQGNFAIEDGVRLRYAEHIQLGSGVYLDHGTYLHACPAGISIGANSMVMKNAILHVYNFRNMPQSGIWIGERSLIGEACILRGQGGITIGNDVFLAPMVQLLAVNHIYHDTSKPISFQGITAQGIRIDDGAWIGGGVVVLDGVRIGKNAVVGAGAVVTRDVPDYCIAVGNPAKVIRNLQTDPLPSGSNKNLTIY
jgi:acetyltransferase-like isoleucine patch superfamily enzyme